MNKNIPAVSIIIPMYNAENYVAECLDSVLAQTFDDYEVIAVDDGSTDKTCEIAESYLPRFDGKLQLIRLKKNSGGPSTPRNIGLIQAVGEYVFFVDTDDVILANALEKLYHAAQKFNADVVHCEKHYVAPEETVSTDKNNLKEVSFETWKNEDDFVKKPTLYTDSLEERVKHFTEHKICWNVWSNIIRREFLAKNDIRFPEEIKITNDLIFTFYVTCHAEKFVRVPNIVYNRRTLKKSNSRGITSIEEIVHRRGVDFFKSIGLLDKFMNKFELFTKKPEYRYAIFNRIADTNIPEFPLMYAQFPLHVLDILTRREVFGIEDKTALTAFLFDRMNLIHSNMLKLQNQLAQQPKSSLDFQRQQEIIARQQAQIKELEQQLRNVHDVFR